jgi:hypothetical protein
MRPSFANLFACQEWKAKYMPVILEGIRNCTNLKDDKILFQARVYAKAIDDNFIPTDNIFHPANWGNLKEQNKVKKGYQH